MALLLPFGTPIIFAESDRFASFQRGYSATLGGMFDNWNEESWHKYSFNMITGMPNDQQKAYFISVSSHTRDLFG